MGLAMMLSDVPTITEEELKVLREASIFTPTMLEGSNTNELAERVDIPIERIKTLQENVYKA